MAKKTVKVVMPTSPEELIDLAKLVFDKHTTDGGASVLNDLNMSDMENKRTTADTYHKLSEKLHKDAVTATQERDIALGMSEGQDSDTPGTVGFYLRSVVKVLLGKFRGNEQKLGDWGFTVVEGTRKGRTTQPVPPAPPSV